MLNTSRLGLLDADIIPAKIDTPLDALVHKLASSLMMRKCLLVLLGLTTRCHIFFMTLFTTE